MNLLKGFKKKIRQKDLWSFVVFDASNSESIYHLFEHTVLYKKSTKRISFRFPNILAFADPFLFVKKNTLYVFFEQQERNKNGIIQMVSTEDLINWTAPATVLVENHHLSFPFVFTDEGKHYMMPESGSDNCIKIYSTANFPFEWKVEKVILTGKKFVDSSIVKINKIYYLFTTIVGTKNEQITYELKLYYSDSLFDNWKEHPDSTLQNNLKYGRSGGSIFKYYNEFFRISQDCSEKYGSNISVHKIITLTKEKYTEELVTDKLFDKKTNIFKIGGHHFNYCNFNSKEMVVVDFLKRELFLNTLTQSILKKNSKFTRK